MKVSLIILLLSFSALGSEVRKYVGKDEVLKEDLRLIKEKARWNNSALTFSYQEGLPNTVTVNCSEGQIRLDVTSSATEKTSTFYHGVFKLGFLFPHPRWQISPTFARAQEQCGKTFEWKPAFPHRGFHMHTLHPNEWVKGFLEGQEDIALDMVRWVARNRQNVLDVSLLRPQWKRAMNSLKRPYALAKDLGISRGASMGVALQQQNSFRLIPIVNSLLGFHDKQQLLKNTRMLNRELDYDFMTMEIGTSEFTSTNYEKTLEWINLASDEVIKQGKKLFTKIHVSTNQVSPKWGNFNFLPRYASGEVGVLPHTVMFYGLYDKSVPMYGNKDFSHMLKFIQEEKEKREVWYYPETSYWVCMDMDVPLLLTDYLKTRVLDMQNLHGERIGGHFNFSSGHELGGWLADWTVALSADLDADFDPLVALKLLGEDEHVWNEIMNFQTTQFKDNQLIAIISFPNLQDEIAPKTKIHDRRTIKEVSRSALVREAEILKLEAALKQLPDLSGVKNAELKIMLEVTHLRIQHALEVRKALRFDDQREAALAEATRIRTEALGLMTGAVKDFSRYPGAKLFERDKNITSYDFGYLYSAATLHLWEREENMVRYNKFSPFYMNIYSIIDIIF